MDKYHENKNTGYIGLKQFFIERQPTAPVIPALTRKVAIFNGIVVNIQEKNGELIKATKGGKAEQKTNAQDAMLSLLFRVNANLRSIANEGTDKALQKLTATSDSDIARMRDTEQKDYANEIYKAALGNATALADYGVGDAMLAQLNTLIENFGAMIGTREGAFPEAGAIRESLYALFPKADVALKALDDTMRSYEESDHEFYNEYILLRPIKSLGVRHKHPPQPANTTQAAPAK